MPKKHTSMRISESAYQTLKELVKLHSFASLAQAVEFLCALYKENKKEHRLEESQDDEKYY